MDAKSLKSADVAAEAAAAVSAVPGTSMDNAKAARASFFIGFMIFSTS
jgi:hypothetical protein